MRDEHELRCRFRQLYEANHGDLARYALRRAGSTEDAADVVADTFLIAWRRLDEVPAGGEARLWLFGVARWVLANGRRAEDRRVRVTDRVRAELSVTAADAPGAGGGGLDAARLAMARLRQDQRDLLGLVAWEGLTILELARVLGCSKNAAKIRVHRARRRFAQELARIEAEAKRPASAGHARADTTCHVPPTTETS